MRAVDNAGNADPTPDSYTFLVDTTAPETSIATKPSNPTSNNTPTFTFGGDDGTGSGVNRYQVQIDGGGFISQSNPFTTPALSDGSHMIEVRAIDNVGNVDLSPASYTFVVDTTAPAVSVSGPSLASVSSGNTVTYTITYTDPNFSASTLAVGNITLNKSGTANGRLSVSGSGNTRTVTISNITGLGTLGISIAAGTATDTLGHTAPAAAPSATFVVRPNFKFDMAGSSSKKAVAGWNTVLVGSKYATTTGYGWVNPTSLSGGSGALLPSGTDPIVLGDYVTGTKPVAFRVFVGANQAATVTVSSYSSILFGTILQQTGVTASVNGGPASTLTGNGVLTVSGTAGADGMLDITFSNRPGAGLWTVNAIEVMPNLRQ
ncbi:MAG: hypothetical protein U0792_12455 [Gemmataceae bacterium]